MLQVEIPTSIGNVSAYYQIPVELALPENASLERKLLLKNYGARIHLTSR